MYKGAKLIIKFEIIKYFRFYRGVDRKLNVEAKIKLIRDKILGINKQIKKIN